MKYLRILIVALITMSMFSGCVVSKKKYLAAVTQGKKSLDSLNGVFNKTTAEFNNTHNNLKTYNLDKSKSLDSLYNENKNLTGTTNDLKKQLADAINDYKSAKENLVKKTMAADSLKRVLESGNVKADSLSKYQQQQSTTVDNYLYSVKLALEGESQNNVKAERKDNKIVITLYESGLFASGVISAKGKIILKKIALSKAFQNSLQIKVTGNTDNTGTENQNYEISAKRAAQVAWLLKEYSGADGKSIIPEGCSQYQPLTDNSTKEGKILNRRTEITLTLF